MATATAEKVAKATDKYEVKGVTTFRGREGYGFNANLYRNGTKVALVMDQCNGGEFIFEWVDGSSKKEAAFLDEHISGKTYVFEGEKSEYNPDIFVSELVEEYEKQKEERRIKRLLKTKTVYIIRNAETGEEVSWSLKAPFCEKVKLHLEKKYGDSLVRIVNEG